MEQRQAKMIFWGTLVLVAALALIYYCCQMGASNGGYRGIMVDAVKWSEAGWRTLCSMWSM